MKPFPPASRLAFLQSNELSSVEVGPYQIGISFVEGNRMIIEHGIEYVDLDGRVYRHNPQERSGPDSIAFHQLIGERIEKSNQQGCASP